MSVFCYASVNSTCTQPHPPGYCGAFARLVSPGGVSFANFALPGGRADFMYAFLHFLSSQNYIVKLELSM